MFVRMGPAAIMILACLSGNRPLSAASPKQVKWEELSMVVGKTVSIPLAGAVITGKATAVEADALLIRVSKTTNPTDWPKGIGRVPRASLHTLELRTKGAKYRVIGTVLGLVAGVTGGALAAYGVNGLSPNHAGRAAGIFVGVAGGATAGGYLLGNAADRRSTTIEIVP